jgi:hypothetical protein
VVIPPEPEKPAKKSNQMPAVDYILFQRSYMEDILPDTPPRADEAVATIEVTVASSVRVDAALELGIALVGVATTFALAHTAPTFATLETKSRVLAWAWFS